LDQVEVAVARELLFQAVMVGMVDFQQEAVEVVAQRKLAQHLVLVALAVQEWQSSQPIFNYGRTICYFERRWWMA
jgi:hypothetical protein